MVAFGSPRLARHATGPDAQSPSRHTPDLWAVMDACYVNVEATAAELPAGSYDAFFHMKRVKGFSCDEPVKLCMHRGDETVASRTAILSSGRDGIAPGAWKMLKVGTIDVKDDGGFGCSMTADKPDWWKSGLLIDCLVVMRKVAPPPKGKKQCAVM